ncbi:molecular chaperone Hsp33 [Mycoplasma testudineum]|uniref:Molecular chaperone Hsp33 n=2 Tax=Mycoplasma testudineum TaxID=244584 RepID=A0A4R6IFP5_9MOLU|nr:molecular chaperone Hsp33 [Mycoplasma testudineum]
MTSKEVIKKEPGSYNEMYTNRNVRILLSDYTVVVNKLLKNHPNATPFAKIIFAKAIVTYAPLLQLFSKAGSMQITINSSGPFAPIKIYLDQPGHIRANLANWEIATEYDNSENINSIPSILGIGDSGLIKVKYEINSKIYESQVKLAAGDFSTDLAYLFDQSWQIFSGNNHSVILDKNNNITKAISVVMQLLPGHDEDDIELIKKCFKDNDLSKLTIDEIVDRIPNSKKLSTFLLDDDCNCSFDKKVNSIKNLDENVINDLYKNKDTVEVKCPQCGKSDFIKKSDLGKEN